MLRCAATLVVLACLVHDGPCQMMGTLDASFGVDGRVPLFFYEYPIDLAIAPDGKIVLLDHESTGSKLCRFLPDGTPDPDFGTNGRVVLPASGAKRKVYVDPLGRIIILMSTFEGTRIARCTMSGTLDPDFGTGGIVWMNLFNGDEEVGDIKFTPDGRLLVLSCGATLDLFGTFAVACLLENGLLDPDFGMDGVYTSVIPPSGGYITSSSMVLDAMGDMIIALTSLVSWSVRPMLVCKVFADGSGQDTFFGSQGWCSPYPEWMGFLNRILLNPEGGVICMWAYGAEGDERASGLVVGKIDATTGEPDPNFGAAGSVLFDQDTFPIVDADMSLAPDGSLFIIKHYFEPEMLALERTSVFHVLPDGSWDQEFAGDGELEMEQLGATQQDFSSMEAAPFGGLILAGRLLQGEPPQLPTEPMVVKFHGIPMGVPGTKDDTPVFLLWSNGTGTLSISCATKKGTAHLAIRDVQGRVVVPMRPIRLPANGSAVSMDLPQGMTPGIYFLDVSMDGAHSTIRFMY